MLVLLPDDDAVLHLGHRKVQLGEEARAACLIDELLDVRQRLHRPQRFIGRDRGIGCVPVSRRSSNAGPRSGGKQGASTSAYSRDSTSNSGESPSHTGTVNAGPSAANEMWPTSSAVPSASVVPESAKAASVCSARAAVASAATATGAPPGQARGTDGLALAPRRGRRRQVVRGPRRLGRRLSHRRRGQRVEVEVQADAAARCAAALGAEADRIRVVKEVEVVRAQPVVAENPSVPKPCTDSENYLRPPGPGPLAPRRLAGGPGLVMADANVAAELEVGPG